MPGPCLLMELRVNFYRDKPFKERLHRSDSFPVKGSSFDKGLQGLGVRIADSKLLIDFQKVPSTRDKSFELFFFWSCFLKKNLREFLYYHFKFLKCGYICKTSYEISQESFPKKTFGVISKDVCRFASKSGSDHFRDRL